MHKRRRCAEMAASTFAMLASPNATLLRLKEVVVMVRFFIYAFPFELKYKT